MCLIAFAIGLRPELPLWLASNRDEAFDRPTDPLHRWRSEEGVDVLGGRDLLDGGTWLGISPAGRVAWLTNVRQPDTARGLRSRGELVTRWLAGRHDAAGFAAQVQAGDYGGFNLVIGDLLVNQWHWIGNRSPERPHSPQTPALFQRPLGPGVYGVSNASLDTPWPKTLRLCEALRTASTPGAADPDHPLLHAALTDNRPAPDSELPATGVPVDMERALSSAFVQMPERSYGTRSSSILRVVRQGSTPTAELDEWQHDLADTTPALNPARRRSERMALFRAP
ncbi:NRDE family protein [uncultured Hydrogenophaga sp.]|uniref:NRDE family protein n=1 Tax=uncultured Hydrogenophaga sp. TaxID=199683 RepID=UPI00265F278D|nr:NRDE family protein [uncultured Hydrogenophaga sp.]